MTDACTGTGLRRVFDEDERVRWNHPPIDLSRPHAGVMQENRYTRRLRYRPRLWLDRFRENVVS